MKKTTTTPTIAVLPLMSVKFGHLKEEVKHQAGKYAGKTVRLDLTDVDTCTTEVRWLELIAEALQEIGICDPEPTASPGCKYNGDAVKAFRRILKLLDERTVRIAFGEQFVRELDDDLTPGQAKKLLDESDGGCVRLLRFRTPAEKQAYLLGINDADGWADYATLDSLNATVSKASRKIPVEQV